MQVSSEQIRAQLAELGFLPAGTAIEDRQSLLDEQVLDSLRMMDLVARLEERYGIRVDQNDLSPDNFETIAAIRAYVNRHLEARHGTGTANA